MLTSVSLETSEPMLFNLNSMVSDELLTLTSISGLSPADVTLFTGDFARDGGYYQGRRVAGRNPVMHFRMNPNYKLNISASDIREMLYRQFLEPKGNSEGVQVKLIDDRKPDRYFIGYTEKIETDIFSKDLTAQVSMICVDPYLRSVNEVRRSSAGGWVNVPLVYDGSADTGIEVTIKVVTDTLGVRFTVSSTIDQSAYCTMSLRKPDMTYFKANDIIKINTSIGKRSIKLNDVDIMAYLSAYSTGWNMLTTKNIALTTNGESPENNGVGATLITEYAYKSAWWGV